MIMEYGNEFEKICRLCLKRNARKLLFDSKYSNLLYLAKMMTGLALENEKNFKTKVCTNCIKRLELIEEFHKKCLESNKYFLNIKKKSGKLQDETTQREYVSVESENIEEDHFEVKSGDFEAKSDNAEFESMDWSTGSNYLFAVKEEKEEVIDYNEINCPDSLQSDDKKMHLPETCNKKPTTTKSKITKRHGRVGVFICEICGNIYNTNEYLNVHKNAKHNPNFIKLKCDICGKEFDFKQSLNVHKAYHNEPSCECSICKKKLHTKKELRTHMLIHSDSRNFKCEICSKAFRTSYNRRVHMRGVHSKLRPFQCDVGDCVKAFSENFLLNLHKKKYHKPKI